jgi:hypothetical protein
MSDMLVEGICFGELVSRIDILSRTMISEAALLDRVG